MGAPLLKIHKDQDSYVMQLASLPAKSINTKNKNIDPLSNPLVPPRRLICHLTISRSLLMIGGPHFLKVWKYLAQVFKLDKIEKVMRINKIITS